MINVDFTLCKVNSPEQLPPPSKKPPMFLAAAAFRRPARGGQPAESHVKSRKLAVRELRRMLHRALAKLLPRSRDKQKLEISLEGL